MLPSYFVYFGVAIQFFGSIKYFIETIKGNVRPNKVSWLLWTLAPMIGFFAMWQKGVGPEMWATFIVGFVPLLIFIASFFNKEATWEIAKFDYICGGISLLGLFLWLLTGEGLLAIIFSIISDASASLPTVVKSFNHPDSEEPTVYLAGIFNAIFALLVITDWQFANFGFPAYLFMLSCLLWILNEPKMRKLVGLKAQ